MAGGGSWKVAYADFVTAMMAFFLLMWILNMAPEESKVIISEYFTPQYWQYKASGPSTKLGGSPMENMGLNVKESELQITETQQTQLVLNKEIKQLLMADAIPQNQSGVTSDDLGTLMYVSSDAMFKPNSSELNEQGKKLLDGIISIIRKHNVFLVVRGHADPTETGAPKYPSNWELSAERATACVEYLITNGKITPQKLRVVAYGDTRPLVRNDNPEDRALNRRVEFNFFRPEVLAKSNDF